jgi:hypothetical protein
MADFPYLFDGGIALTGLEAHTGIEGTLAFGSKSFRGETLGIASCAAPFGATFNSGMAQAPGFDATAGIFAPGVIITGEGITLCIPGWLEKGLWNNGLFRGPAPWISWATSGSEMQVAPTTVAVTRFDIVMALGRVYDERVA